MGDLTIYDITLDERRPATQEDIDKMQSVLHAMMFRNHPIDPGPPAATFDFKLAVYRNPMRDDGVFVAENKNIEPYEGITNLNGGLCYPSVPKTPYVLGYQLPHAFAGELVRRWNRPVK